MSQLCFCWFSPQNFGFLKDRDVYFDVAKLCLLLCFKHFALIKVVVLVKQHNLLNPLSPNSDQHQFSPNNIHRLSSATSMRINQIITKREISDLLSISPN